MWKWGNFREYDFHPATFCELAKNHFETINIKIMNRTDAQLNLREEPMFFQLEFRKKYKSHILFYFIYY